MFYFGITLAIFSISLTNLTGATCYCDPVLCEHSALGRNHIGCNNSGVFLANCDAPAHIPLTLQMQRTILFMHNEIRNRVANGNLARFDSARRMGTMTWDSELEFLAKLNVLQCKEKYDECHNTFEYRYSGQNLGIRAQSAKITEDDYEKGIVNLINEWFAEHNHANQSVVDSFNFDPMEREIGHFTAMIQDKSAKVGCAYAQFRHFENGSFWNALLLTCDYSFSNLIGLPVYVKGPTASGCNTGRNPEFTGLCSITENIAPSPYKDGIDENLIENAEISSVPRRQSLLSQNLLTRRFYSDENRFYNTGILNRKNILFSNILSKTSFFSASGNQDRTFVIKDYSESSGHSVIIEQHVSQSEWRKFPDLLEAIDFKIHRRVFERQVPHSSRQSFVMPDRAKNLVGGTDEIVSEANTLTWRGRRSLRTPPEKDQSSIIQNFDESNEPTITVEQHVTMAEWHKPRDLQDEVTRNDVSVPVETTPSSIRKSSNLKEFGQVAWPFNDFIRF